MSIPTFNFGSIPAAFVSESASSESSVQVPATINPEFHSVPTAYKLNGQNYNIWSHSISIFIGGKGKEDYLSIDQVQPDEKNPEYTKWKAENNMVMSWLLNSMTPEIGEHFMFYKTASEIWEAARDMFSNQDNTSALFEIKGILHDLRQGEATVTGYFTALNRFWQQLDILDAVTWKCSVDGKQYKQIVEKERIYKFLLGLNQELDEVRGRILGTKPMPNLREVFSEVRREESRRRVMLGKINNVTSEGSALATRATPGTNSSMPQKKNGRPWCDHCKRPGHTKETCWKIHGKPTDWKPNARANVASGDNQVFSKEQIEALQKMLQITSRQDKGGVATIAQQGGIPSAFVTSAPTEKKPWIVDCGATDHMTGEHSTFTEFQPIPNGRNIRVATGEYEKVAGIGTVVISKNIILNSVLYVPNLDFNLISPIKLMRDLKCITILTPFGCIFQALTSEILHALSSGEMIGSDKVRDELYHLEVENPRKIPVSSSFHVSSLFQVSSQNNVMLWHRRLGHPNFHYLKKLFPKLLNKSPSDYNCEVCQISKHVRHSYSPLPYKSSHPFHLIHSDVWGPSRVKSISGARWFVTFIDDHTRVSWVFLMKEKSEVGKIFQHFHQMIQNQFGTKIQVLKSDNAKEYFHSELGNYFTQQGIIHLTSCVDTPQQNGVAERKNRHLLEVTRSLLFSSSVPNHFWGEDVLTATYLINRMPSRVIDFKTPLQSLKSSFPHTRILSQVPLKIFGCTSFVHNHQPNRSKLDPRSFKCIFLGYSPNQHGYKCYSPSTKKFYHSMDVSFFEDQPYYSKNENSGGEP